MPRTRIMLTAAETSIVCSWSVHKDFGVKVTETDSRAKLCEKMVEAGLLTVRGTNTVTTECFGTVSTAKVTTYDVTDKAIKMWLP